jgi:hypothetical protein
VARAANSVIAFISLASVCNYTKAYDWRRDRTVALGYLQGIYRDPLQPEGVRMRAAALALPYESPKLAMTAVVHDEHSFALALDRAIRSREGKVLELSAEAQDE